MKLSSNLKPRLKALRIATGAAPQPSCADRVSKFFPLTLSMFPATGHLIAERDLWEVWVPRTKLVVWYRFSDTAITVMTFWHTSQDRQTEAD